jgi:hypothetical protein
MALKKLEFTPGVNRESTSYAAEGTWYTCDKVRFRSRKPEKIGGWSSFSNNTFLGTARTMWNWVTNAGYNNVGIGTHLKYYVEYGGVYNDITPLSSTVLSTNPLATTSGSLVVVVSHTAHGLLTGDSIRIGNASGFNGLPSGVLNGPFTITVIGANSYSITVSNPTPADATGSGGGSLVYVTRFYRLTSNPLATTNGSSIITVTHASHGATTGNFVTISGVPAGNVGGIPDTAINGNHQLTYVTANTYTINVSATATSSVNGGGAAVIVRYEIPIGTQLATQVSGWGAGTWGGFSTPPTPSTGWGVAANSGIPVPLRLWNAHNYGQNLVYGPRGGAFYYWDASSLPTNFSNRGVLVSSLPGASDVPLFQNELLVSDTSRFVIAFGTNEIGSTELDPLLIRWSDQEDITDWTPRITNQAGGIRISSGSRIVAAVSTKQEIVVFTDSAVYSMQYVGPPYVWSLSQIADNVSIMSPHSYAVANNIVYWMGQDKFYMYSGRVETLPCSLRQFVFSGDGTVNSPGIDTDQRDQVICGTNEGYTEVWWFYCSEGNDGISPNRYVVFNHLDRAWYYGTMERTAWLDSGLRSWPMAIKNNRILYHELGTNDSTGDAPVAAINAYIESADFDIDDGDKMQFCWRMIPDLTFNGSVATNPQVTVVVKPRDFSGVDYKPEAPDAVIRAATVPVEQYTKQVFLRFRGRQMAFRIESNTVGTQWQLGNPRIDIRSDGRKS